jgi:general secretion pathway protein K
MTPPRTNLRTRTASGGFIVVAVLWIISALAALAVIYAAYVAAAAGDLAVGDDRLQDEALMTAAIELAAFQLAAPGDKSPHHGHFDFRAPHANVIVHFQTEAARIDLNQAPKELIAGLFGVLGANPDQAKVYADSVVAWRTPPRPQSSDNEAPRYFAAGLDYAPRGAPFVHADELRLVRGLPTGLVDQAMPYVTVFSGIAGIDPSEAAPEVLAAVPKMTPDRLDAVLRERETGSIKADPTMPSLLQTGPSSEASKATRVTVDIHFQNGRRVRSEAVIALVDSDDVPYHVLAWHDGFDDPATGAPLRMGRR